MTDVQVAGETLIDLIPLEQGHLSEIGGFVHRPGGAPANVAVGLSRLGANHRFWTRLSTDGFGEYFRDVLDDEEIPLDSIQRIPSGKSLLAVVTPCMGGEQSFEFYGSIKTIFGFKTSSIPDEALTECLWVHFGGVVMTNSSGAQSMLELASRAKSAGVQSHLTRISSTLLSDEEEARVRPILPMLSNSLMSCFVVPRIRFLLILSPRIQPKSWKICSIVVPTLL